MPDVEVYLNVEPKVWYLKMRNERTGRRPYSEGATAASWAQRWHRRSRDTVTGGVEIQKADVGDDWIRNLQTMRIRVPRIVNGQDYGLPAVMHTTAQVVAIPKKPGPVTVWLITKELGR